MMSETVIDSYTISLVFKTCGKRTYKDKHMFHLLHQATA